MRLFRRRPAVPAEYAHLPEGDRQVLAALLKEGADLTQPRHVQYFADFPDEAAARAAGAELAGTGWTVAVAFGDECCDPARGLEAYRQRPLTPAAMEQDARLFTTSPPGTAASTTAGPPRSERVL